MKCVDGEMFGDCPVHGAGSWLSRRGNCHACMGDKARARRAVPAVRDRRSEGKRRTERRSSTPENKIKHLINRAKERASKNGRSVEISVADLLPAPIKCPVFGTKLRYAGALSDATASLDRIDNRRGYEAGNVRIISYRANLLKRDATPEELRRLAEYAESGGLA